MTILKIPPVKGDKNISVKEFVEKIHLSPSTRLHPLSEEFVLGNFLIEGQAPQIKETFLLTRREHVKIVDEDTHNYMSKPRFEKERVLASAHIVLIVAPPYEGVFRPDEDNKFWLNRKNYYAEYSEFYATFGYSMHIDYWLPRLAQMVVHEK